MERRPASGRLVFYDSGGFPSWDYHVIRTLKGKENINRWPVRQSAYFLNLPLLSKYFVKSSQCGARFWMLALTASVSMN